MMHNTPALHPEIKGVVGEEEMEEEAQTEEEAQMEEEEVQVDHLLDHLWGCNSLWLQSKPHQELGESKSKPLTSLMETESELKYFLTSYIWCSREIQTNTRQMMPKLLQQCHTLKGPMSPGGGRIRLTTFNTMNSHGINGRMNLAQSLPPSIDSLMQYLSYMISTLKTSKTYPNFMDSSLNYFKEAISQKNKLDSPTTKEHYLHGSDAAYPYLTQCLLPSLNGSRELWTFIQCLTSTERWTKVIRREEHNIPNCKQKFNKLSETPPESLILKMPKMSALQLM